MDEMSVPQTRFKLPQQKEEPVELCIQVVSCHTHLVWSNHIAGILSLDTLHHCLSGNSSLENSDRELGHLFHYYLLQSLSSTAEVFFCSSPRHFKSVFI